MGEFERKLKEYEAQKLSDNVEEYKTLDGKIIISDDRNNERYFLSSKKYFELHSGALDELNDTFKKFYNNINSLTENIQVIATVFSRMRFINKMCIEEEIFTESYKNLSSFFKDYHKTLINQKNTVRKYVGDFFEFLMGKGKHTVS